MFGNIRVEISPTQILPTQKPNFNIWCRHRKVVSNKVPFGKKGFKYFIGHKNDDKKVLNVFVYNASRNQCI